jgi:CSLREA domain-containing protein
MSLRACPRSIKYLRQLLASTLVAVLLLAGTPFLPLMETAQAAAVGFVVNSLGDMPDASAGNGVCADSSGNCTLRAAIQEANALAGDETITFSVTGTINLTSALPDLSSMAIAGPGANNLTVRRDTGGNYRIFLIDSGQTVNISGLTISNGYVEYGGGIFNLGTLTLTNSAVSGNASREGNYPGGGIYSSIGGTLNVTNSTVSGNSAQVAGGGIFVHGGTATLTNSTVSGNSAHQGGGIYNSGGTLSLTNSTVNGNSATYFGGIYNFNGTASLRGTIVANNTASGGAGGPDLDGTFNSQGYNLIENTFNAIINQTANPGTNITGVDPNLGPLANNGGPTQTHALQNGSPAIDKGNSFGLTSDQRGQPRPVDNPSVLNASDGSDIGAFEAAAVPAGTTLTVNTTTDTNDGACTTGVGGCTLREAITAANSLAGTDMVGFDIPGDGPHTIQLMTALPALSQSVNILNTLGKSITIRGEGSTDPYRIFTINAGATVTISTLTISSGYLVFNNGAGIHNSGNLTLTDSTVSGNTADGYGGGIFSEGTLTMTNSTVSNNSATIGGGIWNTGTLNVTKSTVSGNSASNTGGGIINGGTATLTNSTISGNSGEQGGGILNQGALTATNATIGVNTAANSGGGIYSAGGMATLRGTIVADNRIIYGSGPDLYGSCNSQGYNLIESTSDASISETANAGTNITGVDPNLGPLQNNGGTTQTHALLARSPAIDRGNAFGSTTDQRGLTRPINLNDSIYPNASDGSDIGAFEAQTSEIDTTAPTVTINQAAGQPDPTNTSPINFTVIFSEAVTGFDSTDVQLSGTAGATTAVVTGSGTTYNVAVSGMTANGTVIATIPAGRATDAAGNPNTTSTSTDNTVTFNGVDTTTPAVAAITRADADPTSASTVLFTVTFSEAVTGVDASDFTLTTSGTITGASATSVTGSGATYTVTVSTGTGSGTIRLDVADNDSITDAAGNKLGGTGTGNGNYTAGEVYTIDKTTPSVTINQASGQTDPTNASPINFTVTFSEAVTGFDSTDVTLSGTAGATTATITGSGTTYNVAVSGMTQSGTVTTSVRAGGAADAAGNTNTASTSTDNTVTYNIPDTSAPSVTSIDDGDADNTVVVNTMLTYIITFSEDINASTVSAADFNNAGTASITIGTITETTATSGIFTVQVTPTTTGTIILRIPTGADIRDTSNNALITPVQDDTTVTVAASGSTVQFLLADQSVMEGLERDTLPASLTITVTRTGDLSQPGSVDYQTSDTAPGVRCDTTSGMALGRCDYTATHGTLRFASGESEKTISIFITDDAYAEGAETFLVRLSNPVGLSIGARSSLTVTIGDNDSTSEQPNPTDDFAFFVRQHYIDFLDREPEPDGFQYWTSILRGCNNDASCLNGVRVEISSRFFAEMEFQRTGYYVMRLWRASYGQFPNFQQFIADRRQVQNNEQSQRAFASQFVQRQEFQARYGSLSNEQFVNLLYDTAGLTGFAAERQAHIAALNSNTKTRTDVLHEVVNLPPYRNEGTPIYNTAWVRMQYFGYLRRDVEPEGEAYWRDVINIHLPNNYRAMICAFLNSREYHERFGARRGQFTETLCSRFY